MKQSCAVGVGYYIWVIYRLYMGYLRKTQLILTERVYIDKETKLVLRKLKVLKKKSMAQILKDLVLKELNTISN